MNVRVYTKYQMSTTHKSFRAEATHAHIRMHCGTSSPLQVQYQLLKYMVLKML